LDSVYGAGERLRPPYSVPQWARGKKRRKKKEEE